MSLVGMVSEYGVAWVALACMGMAVCGMDAVARLMGEVSRWRRERGSTVKMRVRR